MDQRQIKSQQRLMKSLANLLNKGNLLENISIQEIVAEANVSRSTFYRNFDSKQNFLDWVSSALEEGLVKAVMPTHGLITQAPFHNYFHYLYQQREFIKAFIAFLNWPELTQQMYLVATEIYKKELSGKQSLVNAADLANYIVGAHVQVTQAWLVSDDPRSPDEMAAVLTGLTRDILLKGLGIETIISLPK